MISSGRSSSRSRRCAVAAPMRLRSWSRSNTSLASPGTTRERLFVRGRRRLRIVLVVERADGQVAPDHRVGRVELGRAAPVAYRVVGPVVGVAPVAEQGGGGRVVRIGSSARPRGRRRRRAGRRSSRSGRPVRRAGGPCAPPHGRRAPSCTHGGVVVGEQRAGGLTERPAGIAGSGQFEQVEGIIQFADPGVLQGDVEQGLRLGVPRIGDQPAGEMSGPDVQRIGRQASRPARVRPRRSGRAGAAAPPEDCGPGCGRAEPAARHRPGLRADWSRCCRASMIASW